VTCDQVRISLGVYVLGALPEDEHRAVGRHVETCPACAAELAELVEMPRLLGRLTMADLPPEARGLSRLSVPPPRQDELPTPPELPAPDLLDRVLRRVGETTPAAANRRRARHRRELGSAGRMLAAAAGVLLVLLAATVLLRALPPRQSVPSVTSPAAPAAPRPSGSASPITGQLVANAVDPMTHVALDARLWASGWGTAVSAQLTGITPNQHCRLVAVDKDGRQEVAASWTVDYAGSAQVTGSTGIPVTSLVSLRVVAMSGRQLVQLPITR
jgi:anti-sigma factor RsiW